MAVPHPTKVASLGEIGRGGMGTVELCEETQGGERRLVARKTILPEQARDRKARSLFLKEARVLSRIHHPHVVRILGVEEGDDETPPSFTMEYVEGLPLSDIVAKGPVPEGVACSIARAVALGLHAAHELTDERGESLGVVHRDVSPHNVVVGFDGRVTLLDFGVAKVTEGTRTQTGEVRGKIAYMAKEQALADAVDRRSDVCSLGAVLFELVAGERLRQGGTDLEILRRMASEDRPRLADVVPEVTPALSDLVHRMTADDPAERPQTAEDVARALEPFAKGDPGAFVRERFPDGERREAEKIETMILARPRTTRPRSLWAVPVVAVAVVAGVFALAPRGASRSPDAPAATSSTPPPTSPPSASATTIALPAESGSARAGSPVFRPPTPTRPVAGGPGGSPAATTKVLIDPKPF